MARPGRPPRAGERYRRSPALTVSWASDGLTCLDCFTGARFRLPMDVFAFVDGLGDWTTAAALVEADPGLGDEAAVSRLLRALHDRGLVERGDDPLDWPWQQWTPDAAAFHFGTRGGTYPDDPTANDRRLRAKARHEPQPPPTKAIEGLVTALPPPASLPGLSQALLERRTWRNFGPGRLALADLSTLLQLTWGVQRWGLVKGQGRVALKTSPSGGARHPLEAYVIASGVSGLRKRVYHYDAARHRLVDLRRAASGPLVQRLLGKQYYFAGAAVVVVMTAVFGRSMWRYPSSRVYRAIQIEAGHFGQTFCLVATALGLAPFTTIAFQDDVVDDLLGVDGITEGAIYAVGAGVRAPGAAGRPGHIQRRKHA